MDWIPPELRENRGELKAAREHELPELIEVSDIRGELHCHTVASDGRQTIEEMAATARERGYEYIAITDHSATHGFGNDVSPDELRAADRARSASSTREIDGIRVLAGTEVNILPDGSLDYDDDLLAELDWVVGSLHTSFRMSREGADRADDHGDGAPADRRDRPPDRAADRAPRAVRARPRARSSKRPSAPARSSRSTPTRTGAT